MSVEIKHLKTPKSNLAMAIKRTADKSVKEPRSEASVPIVIPKEAVKIFFTIVAWNYISYAATLMASVARAHPDARRYVIVCDNPENDPNIPLDAEILYPSDVEIPDLESMKFAYDVMEFSTAVKPYTFLYFHKNYVGAHIIYTDPDLYLIKPLDHVFGPLSRGAGLVLTPHMMRPLQDGKQPDDLTIMKSGVYNLGFLGTRADEESLLFLHWWADRCRRDAIVDIANHKFTDQRWVDLAPAFVGSAYILRHPGYNIAYWNLADRIIGKRGDTYTSNDEDIHFLHLSGVVPSDDKILSKHQNRFEIDDLPIFAELLRIYLSKIHSHQWKTTSKIPYDFNFFSNRRPIHKLMRASFRRHEAEGDLDGFAAFASDGVVFDTNEPSLAKEGPPAITRMMYELWMGRVDLQRAFPVHESAGRTDYLNWFIDSGAREAGCDTHSIEAARTLHTLHTAAPPPTRRAQIAPWRSQSEQFLMLTGKDLEAWLSSPVPIEIVMFGAGVYLPRILALVWEARVDLRQHFQLQDEADLESYLTWCITRGVTEASVPIDLIGAHLGPYLGGAKVDRSQSPGIPPDTRLMRFVSGEYRGPFQNVVERSPDDIRAKMALTLWLCGTARNQYSWPLSMLGTILRWLQSPSDFVCAEMAIPNLIHACYRLRVDVQETYKIDTPQGAWLTVAWFVVYGSVEFELHPELIGGAFLDWLRAPATSVKGFVRNIELLIWLVSPDLQAVFDLNNLEHGIRLRIWLTNDRVQDRPGRAWLEELSRTDPVPAKSQIRCDLCLTGLWASASGRGEDLRLTAAGLGLRGIPFVIFDRRTERFYNAQGAEIAVDPASIKINVVHLNADTALWDYIALRRAGLSRAYSIGYWAWELERLPEYWNFAYSFYREIWATTRFAYHAFQQKHKRLVTLMPMAVDLPLIPSAMRRADFGLEANEFVFYYGFDFRSYMSRKNPEAAIEGFLHAFGLGKEPVRLILKTLALDKNSVHYQKIAKMAAVDSRITILDREFDRADLYAFIGGCDCFVSPHRSEGFGRGPAEAMLLGVPVIVTNYSGNIDFTTPQTAILVDYKMVPLTECDYPGGNDQHWAEIDVGALGQAMRDVYQKPKLRKRLSKNGRNLMRKHYSVTAVSVGHVARLQEILSISDV